MGTVDLSTYHSLSSTERVSTTPRAPSLSSSAPSRCCDDEDPARLTTSVTSFNFSLASARLSAGFFAFGSGRRTGTGTACRFLRMQNIHKKRRHNSNNEHGNQKTKRRRRHPRLANCVAPFARFQTANKSVARNRRHCCFQTFENAECSVGLVRLTCVGETPLKLGSWGGRDASRPRHFWCGERPNEGVVGSAMTGERRKNSAGIPAKPARTIARTNRTSLRLSYASAFVSCIRCNE